MKPIARKLSENLWFLYWPKLDPEWEIWNTPDGCGHTTHIEKQEGLRLAGEAKIVVRGKLTKFGKALMNLQQ
jgi:hypothetical protein